MLVYESLIAEAAKQAGIKVPPDEQLDTEETSWSKDDYPHWHVFCEMQLGRAMQPGEHWENAKVIAKIPDDKIRTTTVQDLRDLGFQGI